MNRKQRRIAEAQDKSKTQAIVLNGKTHTIEQANTLAIHAQNNGQAQAAIDIYTLILAKVPDHADAHNNRSVALQALGRFDEALAGNNKAVALKPDCAAFHYNCGNSLQALGRLDEALASYDKAVTLKPDYPKAHNNRGNILQALKRYGEALASYDKAVSFKPDYAEAHNNRGVTLQEMQRYDEALASYGKALALMPGYIESYINQGATLQKMSRYAEALASYDKALTLMPGHAKAHNNRGVALQEMKRYAEALASYDKAVALMPDYAEAYNNRGNNLQDMNRQDDALASYDKAVALKPDYAEAYSNRGATLQKMKRYKESLASCDKAIALDPAHANAYQNRGVTLVDLGNMEEAENMFMKALALKPDFLNPLFSLTGIRKYKDADHDDIKTIRRLLDMPKTAQRDREYLYFSLGKIYDDCGRYDEAFECYRQGNDILNAAVSYNPGAVTAMTDATMDVFSKDFLAQRFAFASDSRTPLFIVGMPRSGTTLMASIVSNHPSIDTAGELPAIAEFTMRLRELTGIPYPQAARHITPAIASGMIAGYEKRLRRDTDPDAPHVIDKHPLNCRHLGLIAMLFPNARVIHCTRDPLDTGLSNYFQRFGPEYDYSFDLRHTGHFYHEYARLMEHWRHALPLKMIDISYEDMIRNTELATRRTLDFLGLAWDERCLSPHTNPCAVETASNWQVRQPIYTQSVERWRHYEKHLAPLKDALLLDLR